MEREFGDQSRSNSRRFSTCRTSKENDRRPGLLSKCEQCPEVGVGGDDDPILHLGAFKDCSVVGPLQSVLAYVDRVMPGLLQGNNHVG
jgi:hypothetical protein